MTLRSSPRKRGPRATDCGPWIPAGIHPRESGGGNERWRGGEPNGGSRVVMGEDQLGPRPMFKAPMLLAAVLVVCVASSADARRRHHGYYGYYGEHGQSNLDDWRRARGTQDQGQGGGQAQGQDQRQRQAQDRQGQAQDQRQDRVQDRVQDRRDYRAR